MYRQCILVKWFSHCIIDILFSDHHKNWYKRNCDAKKYPISLSTLYADVIPFPLKVSSGPPYRVYFVKGWQPEIQLLTRKLTESNYIEKEDKPTSVFSFISLSNSMRDKKDNDNKRNAVSERTLSFPETRRRKNRKSHPSSMDSSHEFPFRCETQLSSFTPVRPQHWKSSPWNANNEVDVRGLFFSVVGVYYSRRKPHSH